jgi:hypothetical protein
MSRRENADKLPEDQNPHPDPDAVEVTPEAALRRLGDAIELAGAMLERAEDEDLTRLGEGIARAAAAFAALTGKCEDRIRERADQRAEAERWFEGVTRPFRRTLAESESGEATEDLG